VRFGTGQWISETVATFGLVLTVFAVVGTRPAAVCYAVGLYITGAYRFTASTSFANPAVTVARSLSDTFAGIAPGGVAPFIAAACRCAARPTASWVGAPFVRRCTRRRHRYDVFRSEALYRTAMRST
jgi:hypothetical protein